MGGEGHIAHVVEHAQVLLAVLGGELHGKAVDLVADAVGIGIVVAVAGSGLQQGLHVLVAFEVGVDGLDDFVHGQLLVFKHQLLDGGQGVHHGAQAHVFEVTEVDAFGDVGLVQVDAVLHAQVVHGGAHGLGEVPGTQVVDDVLLGEGGAQEQHVLLHIGVPEFVPGLEVTGIAGLFAQHDVAVLLHAAVAQHHFHGGGEVDVGTAGGEGVAVGHAGLGAAGHGVIQGFFKGGPLGHIQGHDFLVVDQFGEAGAVLDGLGHVPQVAFGRAAVDAGGQVGVVQREFALGLQDQMGQFVGGVAAVGGLATHGHGFPVGVPFVEGAAAGGDVHVDEFGHAHPHAFQQLDGLLVVQAAVLDVLLVVGVQILVHAAVGDGGAGLLLDTGEHLHEPLALAGFPEVAGGLAGHAFGIGGHAQQLGPADGIIGLFGHLAGFVGMAPGPQHDGVAHDHHGIQEGLLLAHVRGAGGIEGGQLFLSLALDVVEAALQDLAVIMHPLDGGTERGGLVDDEAGNQALGIVVGQLVDLGRQGGGQGFVVGLALPVGGDLLDDALGILSGDGGRRGGAGGQVLHGHVQEVAVQFGVQDAVTAVAAGAAQQQLVILHIHGDVPGDVHQGLGPAQHQGLPFGLLHGLGEVQGAFDVDTGLHAVETFQHAEHALMGGAEAVDLAFDLVEQALFLGGSAFANSLGHIRSPLEGCLTMSRRIACEINSNACANSITHRI